MPPRPRRNERRDIMSVSSGCTRITSRTSRPIVARKGHIVFATVAGRRLVGGVSRPSRDAKTIVDAARATSMVTVFGDRPQCCRIGYAEDLPSHIALKNCARRLVGSRL